MLYFYLFESGETSLKVNKYFIYVCYYKDGKYEKSLAIRPQHDAIIYLGGSEAMSSVGHPPHGV